MAETITETFADIEAVVGQQNASNSIGGTGNRGYTIGERITLWLRKAREELDAANAIPGDAHWKAREGKTREQNKAARNKHDAAHRSVEYSVGLLKHSEFQGKLTPEQHAAAAVLFAEAKRVRGY